LWWWIYLLGRWKISLDKLRWINRTNQIIINY
jgi:hypothetical protein